MLKSKLWRSLKTRFQSLSKQQRRLHPDRWLRADCEYNRDGLSVKEQRLLQRGLWSLLDHYWVWRLSEGPNENFRGQFETLAARAAASLDRKLPAGITLRHFWLDNLLSFLRKNGSDQLFGAGETGAGIRNVCGASAICSWRDRHG